jgi:cadmium resistance transport/sequestration family protein
MTWLLSTLITGIISFIATNIDDIFILMLFFSQANHKSYIRQIIIGQYLGFTLLILLSLPGLFGGFFIPKAWIGLLGLLPIFIGIKELLEKDKDEIQLITTNSNQFQSLLTKLLSKETYSVTAVTVANGGDNIGIYIPLFASGTLVQFGIILAIFYLMLGVLCYVAFVLTRQPKLATFLTHYRKKITPWVLIGLGMYIIIENESYRLITNF